MTRRDLVTWAAALLVLGPMLVGARSVGAWIEGDGSNPIRGSAGILAFFALVLGGLWGFDRAAACQRRHR